MPITIETGSLDKRSGTGTQDITITTNLTGAIPFAVIFEGVGPDTAAASGTWGVQPRTFRGLVAWDGSAITQFSCSAAIRDNMATTVTGRRAAAKAIVIAHDDGSTFSEADFTVLDSTHFRLNWTTDGTGNTPKINYRIIAGLTAAKVLEFQQPATAIDKYVSGFGFSPDLVFLMHCSEGAAPSDDTGAYFGIGIFNKHGQQACASFVSESGLGATNSSMGLRNDSALLDLGVNETIRARACFTSMHVTDGFTLNYPVTNGTTIRNYALAIKGVSSKVGSGIAPQSNTTKVTKSRHNFTTKGVGFATIGKVFASAPYASAALSAGFTDLTNQRAVGMFDKDAADPSESDAVWWSDKVFITPQLSASDTGRAAWTSTTTEDFTTTWTNMADSTERGFVYDLLGDSGTNTFPETVHTNSANAASTAYSNQKKEVNLTSGTKWIVENYLSAASGEFFYKPAGGVWTYYAAASIAGWTNGSIDAYTDSGGTQRIVAIWKQSGTGGGRTDGRTYAMAGTFNAGETTITWDAAVLFSSDTGMNYPDLVCYAEGTGGVAHLVYGYQHAVGACIPYYARLAISNTGVGSVGAAEATVGSDGGVNVNPFPSIDYNPATNRLFLTWSAGTTGSGKGVRFRTATTSAGVPTWATEVEVDSTRYNSEGTNRWMLCRWDGTRIVIGGNLLDGANSDLISYESTAFTAGTFTAREHIANAAAETRLYNGSMAVDFITGDIYFFGTNNAHSDLAYHKWTRATTTFGARVQLDFGINAGLYVSAFPVTGGIGFIYTHGAGTPYSVKYEEIILNHAPSVVLNSPANGALVPQTGNITLGYTVTDSDAGDGVTKIAVRRRRIV